MTYNAEDDVPNNGWSTSVRRTFKLGEIQYKQRMTYNGSGLVEYVGEAKADVAEDATGWRIKKLTYSGTNVTQIDWAEGDTNFDKIWDDRAGYTYS